MNPNPDHPYWYHPSPLEIDTWIIEYIINTGILNSMVYPEEEVRGTQ